MYPSISTHTHHLLILLFLITFQSFSHLVLPFSLDSLYISLQRVYINNFYITLLRLIYPIVLMDTFQVSSSNHLWVLGIFSPASQLGAWFDPASNHERTNESNESAENQDTRSPQAFVCVDVAREGCDGEVLMVSVPLCHYYYIYYYYYYYYCIVWVNGCVQSAVRSGGDDSNIHCVVRDGMKRLSGGGDADGD